MPHPKVLLLILTTIAVVMVAVDGFVTRTSSSSYCLSWTSSSSSSATNAVMPSKDKKEDGRILVENAVATAAETTPTLATETAKETYLLMAAEAYEKYYSKQQQQRQTQQQQEDGSWMSQEKYLTLALAAWNKGVVKGDDTGVDERSLISVDKFPGGGNATADFSQDERTKEFFASSSAAPANKEDANNQDKTTEVVSGNSNPLSAMFAKFSPFSPQTTAGNPSSPPSTSFNPMAMFFGNSKKKADDEKQQIDESVPYGLRNNVPRPPSLSNFAPKELSSSKQSIPSSEQLSAGQTPMETKKRMATKEKRPVEPFQKRSSSNNEPKNNTKSSPKGAGRQFSSPRYAPLKGSDGRVAKEVMDGPFSSPAPITEELEEMARFRDRGRSEMSAPAGDGEDASWAVVSKLPRAARVLRSPQFLNPQKGDAAEMAEEPPTKDGLGRIGRWKTKGVNDLEGTALVSPGVGKNASFRQKSFSTPLSAMEGESSLDPLKGASSIEGQEKGFAVTSSKTDISPQSTNTRGMVVRPGLYKSTPIITKSSASKLSVLGGPQSFDPLKAAIKAKTAAEAAATTAEAEAASKIEAATKSKLAAKAAAETAKAKAASEVEAATEAKAAAEAAAETIKAQAAAEIEAAIEAKNAAEAAAATAEVEAASEIKALAQFKAAAEAAVSQAKAISKAEATTKAKLALEAAAEAAKAKAAAEAAAENVKANAAAEIEAAIDAKTAAEAAAATAKTEAASEIEAATKSKLAAEAAAEAVKAKAASEVEAATEAKAAAEAAAETMKAKAAAEIEAAIEAKNAAEAAAATAEVEAASKIEAVAEFKAAAEAAVSQASPQSFDPLKGAAEVEGRKEGHAADRSKATGDISSSPQPLNMKDKKSMPFPNSPKDSDGITTTGNNNQNRDSLDSFNSKGIISKGAQAENITKESTFPVGLKQSSLKQSNKRLPKIGTRKSPAFPSGPRTPVKGPTPSNGKATYQPLSKHKEKALQISNGAARKIISDVSVPPPPAVINFPDSQTTALPSDSERSSIAKDSDASQTALAAADEPWLALVDSLLDEEPVLPLLHVGNRIRSSVYGTTHEGFLVLPIEDINSIDKYQVESCVAKRPWSMLELNGTVSSKVSAFEQQQYDAVTNNEFATPESWELDAQAASVRRYYEVETHIFQKFEKKRAFYEQLRRQRQQDEQGSGSSSGDENDSSVDHVANVAVPKFLRVYPDNGSGGPRADDSIAEYGSTGVDVWGKALGAGHEWLVFEGRLDAEPTLLEAMENGSSHRLHGIKQAMNLPDSEFGEVLDAIFRSLLENLVFLSSSNVVHRDLKLRNILCDGDNQRLRLANFGQAVDLDPPRVGLDNDSIEWEGPGSIANTLAADTFSTALIMCQLIFGVSDVVLNQQLKEKDVGYDLDIWLNVVADSGSMEVGDALDYLRERPGLWSLLKGATKPNPLRKKIAAQNMSIYNEVMRVKRGEIAWTDERTKTIAREESVINPSSKSGELPNEEMETPKPASPNDMQIDYTAFDITRAPYKMQPPTKSSVSALTKLQRRTDSSSTVKRASVKMQKAREGPEGNYFDITTAPFQRISPQPTQRASLTIPDDKPAHKCIEVEVVHIIAPAGKLGAEVDTPSSGGPSYVCSISGNSPLLGQILVGDRIMAVDDEDLQQFSADDVSMILLSKSNNAYRKISLLREVGDRKETKIEKIARTDVKKVPTKEQVLDDEKRYNEVERWLSSYLPGITKPDADNYCNCFIEDGFDSLVMLDEIMEGDFYFMKTAHRRVMTRTLFGLTSNNNVRTLPAGSDHQMLAVKKIYKVDEALGVAARLGIERKLAEGKRLATKKAQVEQKVNKEKKK